MCVLALLSLCLISFALSWFTIAIVRYQNQEFVCNNNTSSVCFFVLQKPKMNLHFNQLFLAPAVCECALVHTFRAICYFILLLLLAVSAINFLYLYLSVRMHTFSSWTYLNSKYTYCTQRCGKFVRRILLNL